MNVLGHFVTSGGSGASCSTGGDHRRSPFGVAAVSEIMLAVSFAAVMLGTPYLSAAVIVGILVVFLIVAIVRDQPLLGPAIACWPLWATVLWVCLGVLWSPVPEVTLKAAVSQLGVVITMFLSAVATSDLRWSRALRIAALAVLGACAVYVAAHPGEAMSAAGLRAFFPHKNNLGTFLCLALFIILWRDERNWLDWLAAAVAFALLVASRSKTSLGLFFLISAVVLVVAWMRHRRSEAVAVLARPLWPIYLLFAAAITAMLVYRQELIDLLFAYLDPDALTGRGRIWMAMLTKVQDDLLFGIGLGAFWNAGYSSRKFMTGLYLEHPGLMAELAAADGGFVDVIAALGFVGLALLLWTILDALLKLAARFDGRDPLLCLASILYVLLHDITETSFFRYADSTWWVFLYVICVISVHAVSRARAGVSGGNAPCLVVPRITPEGTRCPT